MAKRNLSAYEIERLAQLREANFNFWVYRHDRISCEGQHEDLDGLALAPDHPFWSRYYPPLDAECGCYVVGARNAAGIVRLGGNPDRKLPEWCNLPG